MARSMTQFKHIADRNSVILKFECKFEFYRTERRREFDAAFSISDTVRRLPENFPVSRMAGSVY